MAGSCEDPVLGPSQESDDITVGAFKRYKLIDNQLLKPTMGMGLLNIFWSSTIPQKLITKPKK